MSYRAFFAIGLLVVATVTLFDRQSGRLRAQAVTTSTASTFSTSLLPTTSTSLFFGLTSTSTLPGGTCGDPTDDGSIAATDALFTLAAAVGSQQCDACICDADGSGSVAASDALLLLQVAVGQQIPLSCPAC